jgi:hypothetical protein
MFGANVPSFVTISQHVFDYARWHDGGMENMSISCHKPGAAIVSRSAREVL